jgi:hypothetical protein
MIVAEVGICTALDRVRPMVNALRQCDALSVLVDARDEIADKPLNEEQLQDAYSRVARPFFYHLKDCKKCDLDSALFCDVGFELHQNRESILMCFEDAKSKNEAFISHLKKHLAG